MALAPSEINDRFRSLISQVEAGKIEEDLPDTEMQLLTLARHGLVKAEHNEKGWWFKPLSGDPPPSPDPEQDEQTPAG